MLHFQTSLPNEDDDFPFHLIRTPANGALTGVITSQQMLSCKTHFAHNRTQPCLVPDPCELCEEGFSWRWHVYLTIFMGKTYQHHLFETTPRAAKPLEHYLIYHNTLRGCALRASRPSGNPNGRIHIECKHVDSANLRLPIEPNIKKILLHLWNIQDNLDPDVLSSRRLSTGQVLKPETGNGQGPRQ